MFFSMPATQCSRHANPATATSRGDRSHLTAAGVPMHGHGRSHLSGIPDNSQISQYRRQRYDRAVPRLLRALLAIAVVAPGPGCLMTRYLAQATAGELSLLHRGRPIADVLADPETDEHTRVLLTEIEPIKKFASRYGLDGQDNYVDYVELDAPAVVWFVGAADPLAFKPRVWCFPIAGCFPGLGWFDREAARHFRDQLLRDGWDAHMRGADAFSTGGWFHDPVLSSMLLAPGDDAFAELADVILHESVHATQFLPDQTYFNEGAATFVGDALTTAWLRERFGPDSPQLTAWLTSEAARIARVERLLAAYQELEVVYASQLPVADKLRKKAAIIDRTVADLDLVARPNNASLIELATYRAGRGVFAELLAACGGDLRRLVQAVKSVKASDFTSRLQDNLRPALAPAAARCRAAQVSARLSQHAAISAPSSWSEVASGATSTVALDAVAVSRRIAARRKRSIAAT